MIFIRKILQGRRKSSASVAKERLQIIISHERSQREDHNYLLALKEEIIEVIAKYIKIDKDAVKVQLERIGENAVLELNITMPEKVLPEKVLPEKILEEA
jgi:cell division topological specificity factor